jgi:hypothetical protein
VSTTPAQVGTVASRQFGGKPMSTGLKSSA